MQTVSKAIPKSQLVSRRSGMIWIQISRKRIAEWFLTLQKQLKMAWKELLYCLMTQTLLCWCYITWISFFPLGLKELWLRYGTGAKQRFIPIHTLCIKIGNIQYSLLKAHILTGCDVTSKVGTKLAAVNSIKKRECLHNVCGRILWQSKISWGFSSKRSLYFKQMRDVWWTSVWDVLWKEKVVIRVAPIF